MPGEGDFGLCWLVLGHSLDLLLRLAFVRFRRGGEMFRLIGWRGLCSLSNLVHETNGLDHQRRLLPESRLQRIELPFPSFWPSILLLRRRFAILHEISGSRLG